MERTNTSHKVCIEETNENGVEMFDTCVTDMCMYETQWYRQEETCDEL